MKKKIQSKAVKDLRSNRNEILLRKVFRGYSCFQQSFTYGVDVLGSSVIVCLFFLSSLPLPVSKFLLIPFC